MEKQRLRKIFQKSTKNARLKQPLPNSTRKQHPRNYYWHGLSSNKNAVQQNICEWNKTTFLWKNDVAKTRDVNTKQIEITTIVYRRGEKQYETTTTSRTFAANRPNVIWNHTTNRTITHNKSSHHQQHRIENFKINRKVTLSQNP